MGLKIRTKKGVLGEELEAIAYKSGNYWTDLAFPIGVSKLNAYGNNSDYDYSVMISGNTVYFNL